jgi:hypothetical protein
MMFGKFTTKAQLVAGMLIATYLAMTSIPLHGQGAEAEQVKTEVYPAPLL